MDRGQYSGEQPEQPVNHAPTKTEEKGFPGRRFLVLDRLQPGDVILTLEREPSSRITKLSAGGRFSHAAVVLDKFRYLESTWERDYAGVQITFFLPEFFARLDTGEYTQLKEVTSYPRYKVYRYVPPMGGLTQFDAFKREIDALAIRYLAKPYAPREILIRARLAQFRSPRVRAILARPFIVKAISYALWWFPKPTRQGYFCSMLVATLFEDGGLNIFDHTLLMPHHLANSLQSITDRVVISGEALEGAKVSRTNSPPADVNAVHRMALRVAQKQEDVITLITEINTSAAEKVTAIAKRVLGMDFGSKPPDEKP